MAPPAMARLTLVSAMVLSAFAPAAAANGQSVAGVQKVIQMLTDMQGKSKQEKNDEEVAFAKFTTWCSQESANLKTSIKTNAEDIELLTSEIGKLQSETKSLAEAISGLQADVQQYSADKKAADAQREKDHAAFLEEEADFGESVDALERAIAVLKKQDYDRAAASAALLQVSNQPQLTAKVRSIVTEFVSMMDADDNKAPGVPEANGYEFQSGGIVEMLKKLHDEFREKLATSQKEEMNSKHAYNMIVEDLTDSIENSEKDIEEKTAEKERKIEKTAENKKQLSATIDMKTENEKTLSDMTTECEEKKMSFAEKQQLRAEEIEAIGKAMEILKSGDVSGNAEKYLNLAQTKTAAALVQMRGSASNDAALDSPRRKVRNFLLSESDRLHSKPLALLAQKLMADPFAKVKSMIDNMITRLTKEAEEDANHEGFCDTEMGKSKVTRNKLSEDIDSLNAAVEDGKSTILSLTEDTATLTAEVEALTKSKSEATALRQEEKAKNDETVKDAKAAQAAVSAATAVLKDFYEKAATATGFLQVSSKKVDPAAFGLKTGVKMGSDEWKALANPAYEGSTDTGHKEGMQTFGEKEEGQQDENKYGVMAMLELILSDFASLEADTTAAETAAQEAYDRFMVESKKDKAVKERKIEMNDADKAAAELKMQEDIKELKATQDELLAADRYYDKLVPQCVDQGMTWEERVAARQAEIDSLKEALKILGNQGSIETSN
jgi:hypothetical protein